MVPSVDCASAGLVVQTNATSATARAVLIAALLTYFLAGPHPRSLMPRMLRARVLAWPQALARRRFVVLSISMCQGESEGYAQQLSWRSRCRGVLRCRESFAGFAMSMAGTANDSRHSPLVRAVPRDVNPGATCH